MHVPKDIADSRGSLCNGRDSVRMLVRPYRPANCQRFHLATLYATALNHCPMRLGIQGEPRYQKAMDTYQVDSQRR